MDSNPPTFTTEILSPQSVPSSPSSRRASPAAWAAFSGVGGAVAVAASARAAAAPAARAPAATASASQGAVEAKIRLDHRIGWLVSGAVWGIVLGSRLEHHLQMPLCHQCTGASNLPDTLLAQHQPTVRLWYLLLFWSHWPVHEQCHKRNHIILMKYLNTSFTVLSSAGSALTPDNKFSVQLISPHMELPGMEKPRNNCIWLSPPTVNHWGQSTKICNGEAK